MEDHVITESHTTKPNSTNTLKRLFDQEEELVQKLSMFSFHKPNSKVKPIYLKGNPNNDLKSESKGFGLLKGGKIINK